MTRLTWILAHVAIVASAFAPAQTVSALSPPITQDDLNAAAASNLVAMQAFACSPGSSAPQPETVNGSAGVATSCLRSDAKLPRITRAGMATTTDANGTWAITWSAPLPAAPVTLPLPLNTGAQPIVCNVATSTVAGATGRCWLARTLPATIVTLGALVSYDTSGSPASGISVQVLAIPPTQ